MESQPQNPEFCNNPENFHPLHCIHAYLFRISIIIGIRIYDHFIIHCINIEANLNIALVSKPPCYLNNYCVLTTTESKGKSWYQNVFKPTSGLGCSSLFYSSGC